MPKKLEDCVKKVMATGKSKDSAYAICTSVLKKAGYLKKKPKKK